MPRKYIGKGSGRICNCKELSKLSGSRLYPFQQQQRSLALQKLPFSITALASYSSYICMKEEVNTLLYVRLQEWGKIIQEKSFSLNMFFRKEWEAIWWQTNNPFTRRRKRDSCNMPGDARNWFWLDT